MQFCKEQLSSYKVPKSVDIVTSLPHTEIGKVNKVKLREMILAGESDRVMLLTERVGVVIREVYKIWT